MDKMPPIEKIHETYSGTTDGRVTMQDEEKKTAVASSDRAKTYTVNWDGDV